MNKFFELLIESDNFEAIASESVNFLLLYVNYDEIPESHPTVAICHLLLAYHLKPLSMYYSAIKDHPAELSVTLEQNELVLDLLKTVVKNVPRGLKYKSWMAERIARELCEVIEAHVDVHVTSEWNSLLVLKCLFKYDINNILETAVSCIGRLSNNKGIENEMIVFLFSQDKQKCTVIKMLEQLMKQKSTQSMSMAIIATFSRITTLCYGQEIIAENDRIEMYATKFQSFDRSSIQKACLLMRSLKDDFALSLVKTFEFMKASMLTMSKVITAFAPEDLKQLSGVIKVIYVNINKDKRISTRASQIFQVIVDHVVMYDEMKLFSKLPNVLLACLENEKIFSTLLNFVISFDDAKMEMIFTAFIAVKTNYITTLIQAFNHFEHTLALRQVMTTFQKIAENSCKNLYEPLKALFDSFYDDFLQAETNSIIEGSQTMSPEFSLIKMNIMLESRIASFLDYFQYDAIVIINTKQLQDPDDPMFPYFARFHTTVLKMMWNVLVKEKISGHKQVAVPYDLKFVADASSDLAYKLLELMNRRDMNLLEARDVFTSLTELLHYFYIRPIEYVSGKSWLLVDFPRVNAQQMSSMISFAECYVFKVDVEAALGSVMESFYDIEYQKNILTSLAELIRKNKMLPNIASLFRLLQYYQKGCKFEDELETLMKFLLQRRSVFNVTISLVIYQFAKQKASFKDFRLFTSSLDLFLENYKDDKEMISATWETCAFVLNNLVPYMKTMSGHGTDDADPDCLNVLNYVGVFAEGIDPKNLQKL